MTGGEDPGFIAGYRIDSRIETRASEGEILYAGFDPSRARAVAVRALFRSKLDEECYAQGAAELRVAAQAVARLPHGGVVRIHDVGENGGIAYLVMERHSARTLQSCFDDGERFGPARAAAIAERLLESLGQVHAAGVLHRNLSARNVVLGDRDEVKLNGFDLASLPPTGLPASAAGSPAKMSGKWSAMAPEQIAGAACDERTDLFQAAQLVYRLLTGVAAFPAAGMFSRAKQIVSMDPPAPSTVEPSLPSALDPVLATALEKDRTLRYASAKQFAAALRLALGGRA